HLFASVVVVGYGHRDSVCGVSGWWAPADRFANKGGACRARVRAYHRHVRTPLKRTTLPLSRTCHSSPCPIAFRSPFSGCRRPNLGGRLACKTAENQVNSGLDA